MNKAEHRHEISYEIAKWLKSNHKDTDVFIDNNLIHKIGFINLERMLEMEPDCGLLGIFVTQETMELIDREYEPEGAKDTTEDLFDCEINYQEANYLLVFFPNTKVFTDDGRTKRYDILIKEIDIDWMCFRTTYTNNDNLKVFVTKKTKDFIDQVRANGEIPEVLMPKGSFETETDYKALYEAEKAKKQQLETELTEKEKEIEDLQSTLIGHHAKTKALVSYYKDRIKLDYIISKMEEGLYED
jgi:hypothetical protein